ncbi:MAG: family 10 glycosylhydrolase [Kiritimatiellia bacterium]
MRSSIKYIAGVVIAVGILGGAGATDMRDRAAPDAPMRHFNLKWEKGDRQLCADANFLELRAVCSFVDMSNKDFVTAPVQAKYEVVKAAPWILTPSVIGHEDKGWQLIWLESDHYRKIGNGPEFDLSRPGVNHANYQCRVSAAGGIPKGAVSIVRPGVFQVRWSDSGGYLRNMNDTAYIRPSPPEWLGARAVSVALAFTFANLTEYKIALTDFQYDWENGETGCMRWVLTDADGAQFPVLNAAISVAAGDYMIPLTTEFSDDYRPTGWFTFALPEGVRPESLKFNGEILLAMADGSIARELIELKLPKGTSMGSAPAPMATSGATLPIRAVWVVANDMRDKARLDTAIQAAAAAGINTLMGMVLVSDEAFFTSEIFPFKLRDEKYDPLAYLVERGHAAGLKVHAVFCVNHRHTAFRKWFQETYGVDIGNVYHNADGKPCYQEYAVCMQSEEYHDFIVKLAEEVAHKYQIDGMQLDYIRAKAFCQCPRCATEFQRRFEKSIAAADNADWAEFYRPKLGGLVKRVAEVARQHRPEAMMSVAAAASEDGKAQGQFVGDWTREHGYYIMPMAYGSQTLSIVKAFRYFAAETGDPQKVVCGLGLYSRVYEETLPADSRRYAFRRAVRAPDVIVEQVSTMAALNCGGVAFFASHFLAPEIVSALGQAFQP